MDIQEFNRNLIEEFRANDGKVTGQFAGAALLLLTTTGAKSGRERAVHLACIEHEDERFVVASAMGHKRHPAWRYNLEAHPEVEVQVRGERYAARAELLSDAEKSALWAEVHEAIPQMKVYEGRTDRNIRVFRLLRLAQSNAQGNG